MILTGFAGVTLGYSPKAWCEEGTIEENEPIKLHEVVVTGTRYKEEKRKIPSNITVIAEEDIKRSQAQSVPDLLRYEVGVNITSTNSTNSQATVAIRGFSSEGANMRTLILVNGRRINLADMSQISWYSIPLSGVERIEILRGPGTVLYGDNAVGGVINIVTKRGVGKPTFNANLLAGSFGLIRENVTCSGEVDKLSYRVTGTKHYIEGYRKNSEVKMEDVAMNLEYYLTDNLSITFEGANNEHEYGMPGSLNEDEKNEDPRQTKSPNDNAEEDDQYLYLKPTFDMDKFGTIDVALTFRRKNKTVNWVSWGTYFEEETYQKGVAPKYTVERPIFGRANKIVAGIDYLNDENQRFDLDNVGGPKTREKKIKKESFGYYFSDQLQLIDELYLTIGGRYETAKYSFYDKKLENNTVEVDSDIDHNEEAVSTGLSYLYGENSNVYLRYSTAFRFPATDEFLVTDWLTGNDKINKELKPEKGESYEAGISHYFSSSLMAGITAYTTRMKDEIAWNNDTRQNENLDDTEHKGVELSLKWKINESFLIYGNYTWTRAEFTDGPHKDKTIPLVPEQKIVAGTTIFLPYNFTFNVRQTMVDERYTGGDYDNKKTKLPSFHVTDIDMSYKRKHIKMFAGIKNLFDKKYSEVGWDSYYPMPEANYYLGISASFEF